tara:strand:- start:127160 stop:129331 length:2172 start_codon:yes stop_codon:yes gene_type:complete
MNIYFKWLLTLALYGLSFTSYASSTFDFGWTSPPQDKSIEFLGQLFGPVGAILGGPDSGILGSVVQIFNIAVLALGSIVVSYTIIVSTMNTAQEGEVMGRKWSSAWIPLRAAMGTAMLIPAPTYSLIQILFIQITIMGVHAANQIWGLVMSTNEVRGLHGSTTVPISSLQDRANDLMAGLICAEYLNSKLGLDSSPSKIVAYENSPGEIFIGVPDDPQRAKVCGGIKASDSPPANVSATDWDSYNFTAFANALVVLEPAAREASIPLNKSSQPDNVNWSGIDTLTNVVNIMKGTIASVPVNRGSGTSSSDEQNAIEHGWLYAGSYYFTFANEDSNHELSFPPPVSVDREIAGLGTDMQHGIDAWEFGTYRANLYLTHAGTASSGSGSANASSMTITPPSNMDPDVSSFVEPLISGLEGLAEDFMSHMTTSFDDPIASIRRVGSEIMVTCENIWFGIIVIAVILLLPACTMSGIQPFCWAIGVIGSILMPILTLLLSLLWVVGCSMGIYTPMIPYLVFTFTALGWFILVIETVIAAPIVALGVVSPANEVLGKAAPAVMLITGVFLRPSLMVIGFIGGTLLIRTIIEMINYGFNATIDASISGVGAFGIIAIVCLYGGLVLAVVHECFSLVYVLPDKILRWIGGQAEQSTVAQNTKDIEKSVQKGAEAASGVMKGTAQFAHDKGIKPAVDKGPGFGGGGSPSMPGGGGGGMPGGGGGGGGDIGF